LRHLSLATAFLSYHTCPGGVNNYFAFKLAAAFTNVRRHLCIIRASNRIVNCQLLPGSLALANPCRQV